MFEKTENKKEAGVGPFLKKTWESVLKRFHSRALLLKLIKVLAKLASSHQPRFTLKSICLIKRSFETFEKLNDGRSLDRSLRLPEH